MKKYTLEIISDAEKNMDNCKGLKTSAALKDLYMVNEESPKLGKDKKKLFHSLVAKILFATKWARSDTATAISYPMTRVQEPNKDDWQKLTPTPNQVPPRNGRLGFEIGCNRR
jgi:hypothetical protein